MENLRLFHKAVIINLIYRLKIIIINNIYLLIIIIKNNNNK